MKNFGFISSLVIGGFGTFALGIVWYETIVQWTIQENMKIYVEEKCWSPEVGCTMPQNPIEMLSLLSIVVLGLVITNYCCSRFCEDEKELKK